MTAARDRIGGAAAVVAVLLAAAPGGLPACLRAPADAPGGAAAAAARSEHSGIPGTLRMRELNTDQRRTVCDWTAAQYGGYGTNVPCGGAGRFATRVPRDLAACVSSFERIRCDVTVTQFEACTVAAAKDVCQSVIRPPPECSADGC